MKRTIQTIPTEAARLRLVQERNALVQLAIAAKEATAAREALLQEVCNFWCSCRGTERMDASTLSTITRYVQKDGVATVFEWIEMAVCRLHPNASDSRIGKYISGIRRQVIADAGGDQPAAETGGTSTPGGPCASAVQGGGS